MSALNVTTGNRLTLIFSDEAGMLASPIFRQPQAFVIASGPWKEMTGFWSY